MFKETRSWCALLLSLLAPLAGAETPPEAELSSLQAVDAERRPPRTGRGTIAAGDGQSLAVAEDGTVWVWGNNESGKLGLGTFQHVQGTPQRVPGLTGIVSVAAGPNHSLALGADGRVWAWGNNLSFQLGDPYASSQSAPVLVAGLTDVVAIAAHKEYSLALRADGRVWGWGTTFFGQLGTDGMTLAQPTPIQGLSEVTSIAAGRDHALASRRDGTVWAWGSNEFGQRAQARPWIPYEPAPVAGLTGVVSVAAGEAHSLALREDGTVWAWGAGEAGALGVGAQPPAAQRTPVRVPGLTHVRAITSFGRSSLALRHDGSVWGWGRNTQQQLAHSPLEDQDSPVPVQGAHAVVELASGTQQGLARRRDGSVWAWGNDVWGAVGLGSVLRATPTPLPGPSDVVEVSSGHALRADGSVWAWGSGQGLATGATPRPVPGLTEVVDVEGGWWTVPVAVRADGSLWSWSATQVPQPVPGLTNIVAVSASSQVLALRADGRVWSWGSNSFGELGDGTTTSRTTPALIPNLTDVVAVVAAPNYSLALQSTGRVWSWGRNYASTLGDGTSTDRLTPVPVPGLTDVVALAAGDYHVLAARADGSLWGWGWNALGQLDLPQSVNVSALPQPLPGVTQVVGVAADRNHSLARRADGSVWSWGQNTAGQLGRGPVGLSVTRVAPAPIPGLSGVVSLTARAGAVHAVLADGSVRAWGDNTALLIGDGVSPLVPSARRVLARHP